MPVSIIKSSSVMGRLSPSSGFTLVEMAIVIVIIGLVMLTVFPALNAVRSANQIALTQSNLRSLMLATAAYVQANGCLPCPAIPGEGNINSANFGRLGYASVTAACGTCPAPEGIPPFVALGIPASAAHDGWGHWITMRVDPALTANFGVVPPTAICNGTDKDFSGNVCTLGSSAKGLCTANLSSKNTYVQASIPGGATQKAAVIFISHGSSGYGSYFAQAAQNIDNGGVLPFPSNYAACSAGAYAVCNGATTNTTQFYDAPTVVSDSIPYDDILAYADRNNLVSMLGNPGCQTVW